MTDRRPLYWENILFLAATHLLGIAAVVHAAVAGFSVPSAVLAGVMLGVCMLSTTGGYHRLFAHRAYRAAWPLRVFYLFFGAASFEGPAQRWAADHRLHHASTDEEADPHSIKKGFWWAHIGWLFYRADPAAAPPTPDLDADPLVRLQARVYLPLAILAGLVLPMGVASLWGDPLGGLMLAGWLRLLVQYHATFSINSVAHMVGRRPYSTATSARDSFLAAILTLGEGYHNFHHRFPNDYRNGVRVHHFDPTKWCVWLFSKVGLARDLKRAPAEAIRKAQAGI